jgi:hypothetical protein
MLVSWEGKGTKKSTKKTALRHPISYYFMNLFKDRINQYLVRILLFFARSGPSNN